MKKKIEIDPALYQELETDARTYGITVDEMFESVLLDYMREVEFSATME